MTASARLLTAFALAAGCWFSGPVAGSFVCAIDSPSGALPVARSGSTEPAPSGVVLTPDSLDAQREAWAARLNQQRAARKLPPVRLVPALSAAAQAHVADMEARGYFDFTSPAGRTIEAWVQEAGYEAQLVTEKLARTDAPPDEIAAGWGRFPESQKSSLFHPEVEELGIGIGHHGKIPIYVFVLARSRAVALAESTAKLYATQAARLADLPTLRREALASINRVRTGQGMPPLAGHAVLDRVAQTQAERTLRHAAGQLPEQGELARRAQAAGFPAEGAIVGEDVVRDALDAESAVATLLGTARKPQILHKAYTHLGLGVAAERRGAGFAVVWVAAVARSETENTRPPEVVRGPEDPRTAWLRRNAVPLRPLRPQGSPGEPEPADEDFADLQPLGAALAGSRVVLLGEISHGDGGVFRLKSRLVRFLHRELGFSVLAFESGFFDCAKAWQLLAAGEDATQAASRAVFGVWSGSAEVRPLLADLGRWAKTSAPLELAGFDSQFTGTAAADFLAADLERYLRSVGSATVAGDRWAGLRRQLGDLLAAGDSPGKQPPDRAAQAAFARALDGLDAEIAQTPATPESAYWRQLLRSLQAEAEIDWGAAGDPAKAQRLRDRQMAENLLWLARVRYPGRKIIVWAATRHILYNPGQIRNPGLTGGLAYPGGAAMGDEVRKALGREVYALGFTTGGGAAGRHWETPKPIPPPPAGSLEDLWGRTATDASDLSDITDIAFVDFRHLPAGGAWLHERLVARPLGLVPLQADWTQILDGMIYLRTMTPATPAGAAEKTLETPKPEPR